MHLLVPGTEQGCFFSPVIPVATPTPTKSNLLAECALSGPWGHSADIWLLQAESFKYNANVALLPSAATSEGQGPAHDFVQHSF